MENCRLYSLLSQMSKYNIEIENMSDRRLNFLDKIIKNSFPLYLLFYFSLSFFRGWIRLNYPNKNKEADYLLLDNIIKIKNKESFKNFVFQN